MVDQHPSCVTSRSNALEREMWRTLSDHMGPLMVHNSIPYKAFRLALPPQIRQAAAEEETHSVTEA